MAVREGASEEVTLSGGLNTVREQVPGTSGVKPVSRLWEHSRKMPAEGARFLCPSKAPGGPSRVREGSPAAGHRPGR